MASDRSPRNKTIHPPSASAQLPGFILAGPGSPALRALPGFSLLPIAFSQVLPVARLSPLLPWRCLFLPPPLSHPYRGRSFLSVRSPLLSVVSGLVPSPNLSPLRIGLFSVCRDPLLLPSPRCQAFFPPSAIASALQSSPGPVEFRRHPGEPVFRHV